MGATGVLHKSQKGGRKKGTRPFLKKKGARPLFALSAGSASQSEGPDQWPSDPAARRISVGATCDSSLR